MHLSIAVSIHAFREGRRHRPEAEQQQAQAFQSTPSAREGDWICCIIVRTHNGFNPRLPRGKATTFRAVGLRLTCRFNPRLPRGKATTCGFDVEYRAGVSIHAFREGRRLDIVAQGTQVPGFNPRLPRGKATKAPCRLALLEEFQSTPSAREGDRFLFVLINLPVRFNPRLPRGKATLRHVVLKAYARVSIHAFREGRRQLPTPTPPKAWSFNPRLPRGKATKR